ncbi:MAG: ankyrin repeat domain-containing protein [Rhodocyclaceae bacterium]|nr:ankyrin repeat domain-containing protein [Rhodocyclaceae bacterium]
MKHPFFADLFKADPEKYPSELEARFERILNRIAELWHKPDMEAYFDDLLIDKRGGRQGFPPEVGAEIFRLFRCYEDMRRNGEIDDVWAQEPELEADKTFTAADLGKAVEANDLKRIAEILASGMSVDTVLPNGWTPLQWATFCACEDAAMLLVEKGATVGVVDSDGYTPLHWACLNGFNRVVPALIERGAGVNTPTRFGISPLMQASGRGHAQVARVLIENSARVNHQDREGWTPLHKAVSNGHVDVANLLYKNGANPGLPHKSGVTAAEIARQSKRPGVRLLFRGDAA